MICQAMIFILGAVSIWLLSCKGKWQLAGFVVGLLSEPFWMYEVWINKQWGIALLAIWYSVCYIRGITNHRRDK